MSTFAIPLPVKQELNAAHILASLAQNYYWEVPQRGSTTSAALITWAIKTDQLDTEEILLLEEFPSIAINRDNYL